MDTDATIPIRSFSTETETLVAAALLEAEGIRCVVARIDPFGVKPLVGFTYGAQLLVPTELASRARTLLEAGDTGVLEAALDAHASATIPTNDELISASKREQIWMGLNKIKQRQHLMWLVFFSYLPIVMAFFYLSRSETITMYVAVAWMVLYAVSGLWVGFSRCPRCGRFFHMNRRLSHPWTGKCLHCGLSLHAEEHLPN